jgi:hypothetical protein
VGEWSETWGTPGETDVTYHDTYVISVEAGKLAITSPGRPKYHFLHIAVDGRRLVVKLENNRTVIDYDLRLDADGAKLVGRAKTNRGADVPIVWDRR